MLKFTATCTHLKNLAKAICFTQLKKQKFAFLGWQTILNKKTFFFM